jgi:hypothetical protein
MSFRKEKKFRLTKYDYNSLKNKLLLQGMEPLYAKREINSLYYDTKLHSMYHDSEEGLLPRRKIRVRWYDDVRKASNEVKISSFEGRFKTSSFVNVTSQNALPKSLNDPYYGIIFPSLFVSYSREYFSFKSMRITFDSAIKYVNHRLTQNIPFADGECVMEIKVGIDVPDDYIEMIIPFSTSRFSKYSRGLLITNCDL